MSAGAALVLGAVRQIPRQLDPRERVVVGGKVGTKLDFNASPNRIVDLGRDEPRSTIPKRLDLDALVAGRDDKASTLAGCDQAPGDDAKPIA
jgi:hypothetical protein